MTPRLPLTIYSPDQLSLAIQELRTMLGKQRDQRAQAQLSGKPAPQPSLSPDVDALLTLNHMTHDNLKDIESLIGALETLRLQAPIVHLTFAALPSAALTQKLIAWFRDHIHEQLLLSFVMSREIGGGVVIQAGSSLYDFSFRSQLLRRKDRIAEIFASAG